MEFKAHIEKLVGASNWSKWKRHIELLLRYHDVVCEDRKCPSLSAEASAEVVAAPEKAQKAFVKDDSLAQLILVGNMDAKLAAIWRVGKVSVVYEQSSGQRLDRLMEKFFRTEAVAAHEKAQKAFVKDDSLAQLILVGDMDAKLAVICVWEKFLSYMSRASGQRLDRLMEKFFRSEIKNWRTILQSCRETSVN
ncbi:retrovirus-related Pol polyprotein from transposon TNT 1-94 [Trichonephila clavipes]|nr:retrovirus-related Pol polyprotein from transposon TNT 1-94 [Trichonephila clavipes]